MYNENDLTDNNIIKSTVKVFIVLEVLTSNGKLGLSKLSKLSGLTMGSTQRIVNTLKYMKYIDQDINTSEYYPSIKLYELGNSVLNNYSIKNVSKPHLIELHRLVDETVNLGIIDNNSVVYLDKIVSKYPLRAELDLGIRFPTYCSALGKAIMAFNEDITFNVKYEKFTEHTINSDEKLEIELNNIKKHGYSIDNEEFVNGLICIGVPILNLNDKAIASISISVPKFRYVEENLNKYLESLKKCAKKIQNDLY